MKSWSIGKLPKMKKGTKKMLKIALVTGAASGVAAALVSRITLKGAVESLADSFERIKLIT
jgi:NADP-dependent 3-hydroxy acid dehydrogenase YdfG